MKVFKEINECTTSEDLFNIIEKYYKNDIYDIEKGHSYDNIDSVFLTAKNKLIPSFRINYYTKRNYIKIIKFNSDNKIDLHVNYDFKTKKIFLSGKTYNNENNKFLILIEKLRFVDVRVEKDYKNGKRRAVKEISRMVYNEIFKE